MFLYIKSHPLNSTRLSQSSTDHIKTNVQRLIPLKHVQYIDYDPDHNELHVKLIGQQDVDVYAPQDPLDRSNTKRVFYDILKDARANSKVVEW